jgi:hypothetical protein
MWGFRCDFDGTCICFSEWKGQHCDARAMEFSGACKDNSDCGEGGICDRDSGECQCSALHAGARCETCGCGGFSSECIAACDSDVSCSGNGRFVFPTFMPLISQLAEQNGFLDISSTALCRFLETVTALMPCFCIYLHIPAYIYVFIQ